MIIKGDINGDGRITIFDKLLLKYAALADMDLSVDASISADINSDGKLNFLDISLLGDHLRGLNIINEVID